MIPSKKTLREHHYQLMIEALQDDPRIDYPKRIVTVELMAVQLGWSHICSTEAILNKVEDIYHA